jgi:hypothetical protein
MNKNKDTNKIGEQAESFVKSLIDTPIRGRYLFDIVHLGGKWETSDYYVEIRSYKKRRPFFFLQIKGSEAGFNKKKTAVQTKMTLEDLQKFSKFDAPSYLIAVNVKPKRNDRVRAFITTIRGSHKNGLTRIPVEFELTESALLGLKKEVYLFWNTTNTKNVKSLYKSKFERPK